MSKRTSEKNASDGQQKRAKRFQQMKERFKKPQNSFEISPGMKGFFVTSVRGREKKCALETIDLLEEYAAKLYPNLEQEIVMDGADGKDDESPQAESNDIEDEIAREVATMKSEKTPKLFRYLPTTIDCLVYIKCYKKIDPERLVQFIFADMSKTKQRKTRFTGRLIPAKVTTTSKLDAIVRGAKEVARDLLAEDAEPTTFALVVNIRYCDDLKRDEVIPAVAAPLDTKHKVDLKNARYTGRIFNEKEMPHINRIDLIQLENSHQRDAAVFVDRYDIRHLVLSSGANEEGVGDSTLEDDALNLIRYKTLYSLGEGGIMSETDIFDMDPEERHAYIDYLSHSDEQENHTPVQNPQGSSGGISLQYDASGAPLSGQITENSSSIDTDDQNDKDSCSKAEEKTFVPSFAVPDGVALPTTQRHFEIIERTARFLADQQDSNKAAQMEIVIQGKQGTNADFEFLNRSSRLHSFYKHILWLMQTGLYGYNHDSSSEPDTEPEENNAIDVCLQPQNAGNKTEDLDLPVAEPNNVSVPDGVAIPADLNRRLLIDKVARLVGNSPSPTKLEQKLRVEKATSSSAYSFLSPFDEENKYYCFRRDCHINSTDEVSVDEAVADALRKADELSKPQSPEKTGSTASVQAKRRTLALEFLKNKRRSKE
ncbi:hypothetical protein EV177_005380 [Coemansia sp. RSA 1804]|nr:hypothetical protein EV177_005380 [Coemansia sp. RSA 1804]